MKKLLPILIFVFASFINMTESKAITDPYTYDINSVELQVINGEDYLVFSGWAFIEHQHDSNPNALHNLNPDYTFYLAEKGYTGGGAQGYKNKFYEGLRPVRTAYNNPKSTPDDLTKAYFDKAGGNFYPDPTSGGERAVAVENTYGTPTNNRFVINVNFKFQVPFADIKKAVEKHKNLYMYINVQFYEKDNAIIYGKSFGHIPGHTKLFQIGINEGNISAIARKKLFDTLGITFEEASKQVTVISTYAQGRNDSSLDTPGSYYQIINNEIRAGTYISGGKNNLYYNNSFHDGNRAIYDIVGKESVTAISAAGIRIWAYKVRIGGYENCWFGKCLKNDLNGETIAWIPAYWVRPTTNQTHLTKEETCETRSDCGLDKIDETKTCPPRTTTPNCCSLCIKPNTKGAYANKEYCTNVDKCGICETDTRCQITNGVVGNNCPTEKTNCCSLCTDLKTRATYSDTSFCRNVNKCGTCETDKRCETSKLGLNTECPVNKPSDPMSADCCKTICAKTENQNTDYCKKTCKKQTTQCNKRPECKPERLNGNNITCESNKPNCCSLCTDPSTKATYAGTKFCTDPSYCGKSTPPSQACNTMTDPQEKYCCEYPGMPFCDTYKETDPNYDPSDPTPSKEKKGICDKDDDEVIKFKYPAKGYGQKVLENEACSVSCQEIQDITFQKMPTLRAGMGFEYPIKIEGTRYCTAEYKNESWESEVKSASTNANASYERFKVKYREAERLDKLCGVSDYEDQSPKNNCDNGYSLIGGVCQKTEPFINECREGSYDAAQDICVITHDPIRSDVPLYIDPETGESKCLATSEDDECVTYTNVPPTTAAPTRCKSGGATVGGQCLYTKSACNPRYDLFGSTCKINLCSISREYYPDASNPILRQAQLAEDEMLTYQGYFNRYSTLLKDRKICDEFSTSEKYDGPAKIKVSYEEDPKVQVSEQEKYAFLEESLPSSQEIGDNKKTPYQIYDIKPSGFDMSYSINAAHFEQLIIKNNFSHYSFYPISVEYVDYWNNQANKETNLEFSKMYYVQRYTGELKETQFSGYEKGERFVYTDFYQKSGKYKYDLNAINIGPNLPNIIPNILVIKPFTCSYNLTNLIFPPKGDINYNQYGNTGFEFRQISLTEPFPNRQARENWLGKESLITNVEYGIYNNQPLYHFNLNSNNREKIRFYNSRYKYDSFNPTDPYKSNFLKDHSIIFR